ncbi:SpaA isopeptide-forming pilin-related protein [Microbacterium sp. ZW T5_56]|uniref:DUF7927 domain-containing protein n=1 Tax=Microbacterium sp. ZW T5_56 TaxID=3378081 RepID=UPI003854D330
MSRTREPSPRRSVRQRSARVHFAPTFRRVCFATAGAFAIALGALAPAGIGLTPATPAFADVTVSGVVNSYQKVSAVSGNTVTVTGAVTGAATPFAVGDKVMLIQMTGVAPVQSGSNMGNYDNATITAISGGTITLSAITRTYSPGTEAVQLVRAIHDAGTVTVSAAVTAKAWDGSTGGVVALSGGILQLDANIDASAKGFNNVNTPTGTVVPCIAPATGQGQTTGRGGAAPSIYGGLGGGGIDGGGGTAKTFPAGRTETFGGGVGCASPGVAGTNGGNATGPFVSGGLSYYGGAKGGASGGGGVTGGGGAGGALYVLPPIGNGGGGGGGGVNGGGGGAWYQAFAGTVGEHFSRGGGGTMGVGNGGDGIIGGTGKNQSGSPGQDGSAGGGGGSYGGGGGAANNNSGGDDSAGGGGGGSWTGGGAGGFSGGGTWNGNPPVSSPIAALAGGNGNAAVGAPLPDDRHYLNLTNPRLMMGGAGGRGSADSGYIPGGVGGGIVYADFQTIAGAGDVVSNGGVGASPATYGGGAHSGAGGGGGGQMRIRAQSIATTGAFTLSAEGGLGGVATRNTAGQSGCSVARNDCHAGVSGAGGGAGGIWVELVGAVASCPADPTLYNIAFELDGGSAGGAIANPKNNMNAGTGGDGGTGLGCISSPPQQLTFEKTSDPAPGTVVKPGDEITYTVTVKNITNATVTDGLLTDDMSAVLDKATLVTPPTLTCTPAANQCGAVSYTAPATQFTWTSSASAQMQGMTTATITYKVKLNEDDPATPDVNEAAVGTVGNVLVEPGIHVDHPILITGKDSDPVTGTQVDPGDTVTYTIWFENTGSVPATAQTFTDDLSAVLDKAKLVPDNTTPTLTVTSLLRGTPDVPGGAIGTATFDGTAGAEKITWTGDIPAHTRVSVTYAVVVNVDDPATPNVDEGAFGELQNVFLDHGTEHPVSATLVWNKVDAETAALLAGSIWKLTPVDANGAVDPTRAIIDPIEDCVAAAATDCLGPDKEPAAGKFRLPGLVPGEYELEELQAPTGYDLLADPIAVTVRDDASVTVLEDIENEAQPAPVSLLWQKVDASGVALIGSEWKLTPVLADGSPDPSRAAIALIDDCHPDNATCNGIDKNVAGGGFRVNDLLPGLYDLEETKAPAGFEKLAAPIRIAVEDNGTLTEIADIVNEQQGVPSLPLTGGLGSDSFWILGGGLGLFTVVLLAWFEIRSRRSRATLRL